VYLSDISCFQDHEIVVTEKMDGENTSMYRDAIHARSLDSANHPSRSWVRGLHGQIRNDIPEGWRVCGENLYAKHSIGYEQLPSYFMVFSIWTDMNDCLSWDDTQEWASLLGLDTVPVLYRGLWDVLAVKECYDSFVHSASREGYVVRLAKSFPYSAFGTSLAKFVRTNHVQTSEHWMTQEIVPNKVVSR
jgi:hypothetical protein